MQTIVTCPKPVIAEITVWRLLLGVSLWQAVIWRWHLKLRNLHAWCAYWPVLFDPNGGVVA